MPATVAPDAISQSNPLSPTTDIPSSISASDTVATTPSVTSKALKPLSMLAGLPICMAVAFVFGRSPRKSSSE